MSTVISSTIDIDAGPREVWEILTDFAPYGEWCWSRLPSVSCAGLGDSGSVACSTGSTLSC
jgi:hypothetical protein